MKALVLYGPKEFYLYYDADVYPLYRELKGFEKKLFKLYEHFHFCSIDRWLAAWKDNVEQYDVVIIFDGIRGRDVLEYIRRKNKRIKIKIYYINLSSKPKTWIYPDFLLYFCIRSLKKSPTYSYCLL